MGTGMSELEEGLLSGEIEEEEVKESGSGMSLSVAQPLVRDWLAKRRANLRPVGTFFNTANFQVPPSAGRLSKRLVKNVDYFQSNYVLVFLILVLYCLISSPLLLIVIAGAGGAAYFASIKNETRKIAIAGHEVTLAQQYAAIATASIPFFLLAGAGGIVFWVLGASLFFITLHAAFYNYDSLEVPEDQEAGGHHRGGGLGGGISRVIAVINIYILELVLYS